MMKKKREILILLSVVLCGCSKINHTQIQASSEEQNAGTKYKIKLEMNREDLNRLRHEHHLRLAAMREIYTE